MAQNYNDGSEARRRGRPRAYDAKNALCHATEAFWRTGYTGTSLDEIAAVTGMNRPSLRAAFGDKHALYLKALSDYWEAKFVIMSDALAGGTLEQALARTYDAALSIYYSGDGGTRGCFVVATALVEAAQDLEIRKIVAAGLKRIDAGFEARIRSARDAGELAVEADVEALAMLASATMHSIAVRARGGAPRDELERLAGKVVKAIGRPL